MNACHCLSQLTEGYGQTECAAAATFQLYNDLTTGLSTVVLCFVSPLAMYHLLS